MDIGIYDLSATRVRLIATRTLAAGDYTLVWDGRDDANRDVANGMYWAVLTTPDGSSADLLIRAP